MMVGRRSPTSIPSAARAPGDVVLAVERPERPGVLHDIDLDVRAGEILGICGLAGSGRTELLRALVGADPARSRELSRCAAARLRMRSPRAAIREGIGLLPEDRKTDGCFLPQSVAFNVTISRLAELLRQRGC